MGTSPSRLQHMQTGWDYTLAPSQMKGVYLPHVEATRPENPCSSDEDDLRRRHQILEEKLQRYENDFRMLKDLLKTKDERLAQLQRAMKGVADGPTESERRQAMTILGFVENHIHVAVAGTAGVGKSSMLNAIRGLGDKDKGAAETGATETTAVITRYPDSNKPVIYYDVPGAGTMKIHRYDYFKAQGLYVMNALVLVWGDRLTDTDVDLMKNCIKLKVPFFLVRSKCDQYIRNYQDEIRDELGCDDTQDPRYREAVYEKIVAFANESIRAASEGMKQAYQQAELPAPPDSEIIDHAFLVNRKSLLRWIKTNKEDEYALDERLFMDSIARVMDESAHKAKEK